MQTHADTRSRRVAVLAPVTVDPGLHLVVMGHTGGHEQPAWTHAFGQLQGVVAFSAAAAAQNQNFIVFSHNML